MLNFREDVQWASDLTWLEAAISVGRAVSNPKMDGRYVTERERKFLIYRAPGRKGGGVERGEGPFPFFLSAALRTAQETFAVSVWNLAIF